MAVLTGCTKETTEPTDNKPDSSVSTEVKQNQETTVDNGEEDPSIDTSKHVDLILYLWGSVTDGGDAVMEVINEKLNNKINADIEIKFIDWGDIATKYPLLFASGEEFDMTFTSATANPSYFNLCSKNAFTPITDLLPEYAPLTWEKTPEYMWEDANYQGEIYGIPSRFSEYVPMGFIYRGDLLKKYNMDAVSSVEDMEAYFDKVLENEEDMSPLLVESQSYAKLYDMFIAMTGKWLKAPGLEPNTLYLSARSPDKINDIFSPVFTDEFMEFAKVMKQWETKGYLPKDVMSITEIADTQWINEKGASYLHHAQGYAGGYGGFVDSLPESDPMYFNFGDINKKVFKINAMQTATGFSVNSNNVERALMAVDLIMNTEELYKLWQYGVEG
jgi:putative aldouronate transport system substrate-binding protein